MTYNLQFSYTFTPVKYHMHYILALRLWGDAKYWRNKYPLWSIISQFDIVPPLWRLLHSLFWSVNRRLSHKKNKNMYMAVLLFWQYINQLQQKARITKVCQVEWRWLKWKRGGLQSPISFRILYIQNLISHFWGSTCFCSIIHSHLGPLECVCAWRSTER